MRLKASGPRRKHIVSFPDFHAFNASNPTRPQLTAFAYGPPETTGQLEIPYFGRKISHHSVRNTWEIQVWDENFHFRDYFEIWMSQILGNTEPGVSRKIQAKVTKFEFSDGGKKMEEIVVMERTPWLSLDHVESIECCTWEGNEDINKFVVRFNVEL